MLWQYNFSNSVHFTELARYLGFWPAFCLLLAYMQGVLIPAIRRTPPGKEADRQAFALHWVGAAAYFLPLFLAPAGVSFWAWWLLSFTSRGILFDVGLNAGAGDPLFSVGKTALWDRMLRKLAPGNPARLNALVKASVLILCVVLLLYLRNR